MKRNTGDGSDDDDTTLFSLILAYKSKRVGSFTECQTDRLNDVLIQLTILIDEYNVCFRRTRNADDEPLVVVCFYHAPITLWGDQTYATCLSSLITTFFNPHCVLPSSQLAATLQPGEESALSVDEVRQLQLLFGGVLDRKSVV